MKTYIIAGNVVERRTGRPMAGLQVEAWDKDLVIDDLLGTAETDDNGSFTLNFDETYYQEICVDRKPDIYFKVFYEGKLIKSTEDSVLWNVETGEVTINIPVSIERPQEQYAVKGKVKDKANNPLPDLQVQAIRRYLRKEMPLGSVQTSEQGEYNISYFVSDADESGLNLMLKVFDREGKLVHQTEVHHNVPKKAEIDIQVRTVFPGFSEFERMVRTFQPLLEKGLTFADLEQDDEHDDISFLSGKTGIEVSRIARFVMAHKLAQHCIQPEFWFALLGGSFFQYTKNQSLKNQLAAILDSLSSLDAAAVRKALTRGFNLREIPETFREKVTDWVEVFLKFIASRSVSGAGKPTFVKFALEHAGIKGVKKQEKFARLFNEHKTLTPELLETLEKDDSFKKAEIADLHTSFRLAELTRGDFSVVKVIKEEFGIRQPEKIRGLAKKSESEWVNLIKEKHAAGEIKLPFEVCELPGKVKLPEAEVYGKTLERQFREAFPTTAFSGGLERALSNGGAKGLRHAEALSTFLDVHKDFELLNTPVDEFINSSIHPDLGALAKDESFRLEIKAIQRVFKLAPTFEATDSLLADNLHSAQKIYRMGETEFVRRYGDREGFTPKNARRTWNHAADTHAAVLTIVADLKALEADALPLALKNGSEALSNFPNWNNLFKTGDLCECEHCRSVLSPAGYFADLLMFLKDRNSKKPNPGDGFYSVKDILFDRRHDLGYLELNCDNALTPLPYIDVVCEVLEDMIDAVGGNDLELSDLDPIPSGAEAAQDAVSSAFERAFADPVNEGKEKIELGSSFSISQVNPSDPDQWVIHGDNVTYLLKKKIPSDNFFAEILRNTKASADELRAYPQYVNLKAYEKLREAKYPSTLPFDLFAEEVRAAFKKCNLQRWDLMRTLRGPADPNDPSDGEIAAEYFGISADPDADFDEMRLILEADPTPEGQQERWGEIGDAGWLDTIAIVKIFLLKTGLDYNELLALLDLKFINPDGGIAIQHDDPSCDTDKKSIQVLDAPKLDRIHRFLRLCRKLKGWKMWELDLVIRHLAIGNEDLNEPFLIQLFYFDQLKKRLGKKTTIEHVCALFGDLNTETRFTRLHKKREDGLYQSLFLNRRLIQPLDPAFQIDPGTGDLPAGETITAYHPVMLAAMGIRESDLVILQGGLTTVNDIPYIIDDLTLKSLSILWRHAWLAKILKFNAEEWKILLKIFHQGILDFADSNAALEFLDKVDGFIANPKAAWEFVETIDHLKAAGFKPDELNWLLTADRSAKAVVKESDAARFLAALRKELHAIWDEYDVEPPTDVDNLAELLTSLLQKLNRSEAETQFFIATLRDELNQEKTVSGIPEGFSFPESITGEPHNISIRYNPVLSFSGRMTEAQRTTLKTGPSLSAVTGLTAYQDAIDELFEQPGRPVVAHLPTGFTFPESITDTPNHIPISYKPVIRFAGLMISDDKETLLEDPSLSAVTGIAAYQEAIEEFFARPYLALKFFEPVFTAPLIKLPAAVDFKALPDAALVMKISYDAEQRLLRFAGIMSKEEKTALNALSADATYRNAVDSLATQPGLVAPTDDERIWLLDADLQFPLRDLDEPANDHLAENLAKATTKALAYLSKMLSENTVVQQSSAQLGLTEALTRYLLTHYAILPDTLMTHLTGTFAVTTGVVDYATLKTTFDGWFWTSRVAIILKKWKITLAELEKISALTTGAQLLDFRVLPLDDTGAMPSADRFLRTSRLLRLRDRLPETKISFLEVLEKLSKGTYATVADFATDVERLNEAWVAADVEALTASLDLAFPDDYLLPESWERLRRAFYFLDSLNTGAYTAKTFAGSAMTNIHAKTIKELLRSKFGTETWFTLSAEIQDVLRERKREALVAYLLAQPKPDDAPSGKWENTNDLYAYYLLDVEMSSCQLTSRLVQSSGSVQLFVQRCFMGLEPEVVVNADGDDGDSAWRWWKWMSKYRVWEANRKVFLWPENWIEPELKKDRSPFFKDLENELLQNEINQHNVETAFSNYLEKLDGVAQLEIAGFYQEDDGDNAIIHVFGRTTGAEPHLYYYRRYDYRQWTPWEKVELDIQGDYLIPAVVDKRLFLFWPVFTEVPDEEQNKTSKVPTGGETNFEQEQASKRLRLQMAVSEYRQGKWTPKKISKDFDESCHYQVEIVRKHYRFFPIDRSEIDGRFGIKYDGHSLARDGSEPASLYGAFEISGCKGIPELASLSGNFTHAIRPEEASTGENTAYLKWVELGRNDEFGEPTERVDSQNDFTLENLNPYGSEYLRKVSVLMQTPGIFKMSPPWHFSYLDRLWLDGLEGYNWLSKLSSSLELPGMSFAADFARTIGTWLPFFYNDKKRTFFVLPSLWGDLSSLSPPEQDTGEDKSSRSGGHIRNYYPEIKRFFRQWKDFFEGKVQGWVNDFDLTTLTPVQRQLWEQFFYVQFPKDTPPPYTDEKIRNMTIRFIMRFYHLYLGALSQRVFQFRQFHFKNFYHPFVCDFAKLVHNPLQGIPALMSRETQLQNTGFGFYQTYRPSLWVVEDIPLEFALLDIKNIGFLASKLGHPEDGVSAYIHDNLSAATHRSLADYLDSGSEPGLLQSNLVADLNGVIANETVYDERRFADVDLRPKTWLLLDLNPSGALLICLNRWLLEDAYPREISRDRDAYPKEVVDFTPDGAYSPYNWELFFHAPLLIANSLSKNQRFEEAREWYHFMFNPIGVESAVEGGSPMSKYWITKPFFKTTGKQYMQQRIDNILRMLAGDTNVSDYPEQAKKDLEDQVHDWRTNPFEPHRIANYRTVAYQKTVVMKYLDNLIAWGDYLFRQDSMESINEATQLYILSAEILGPRPKRIPPQAKPPLESFNELEQEFDKFSNALVEVENLVPLLPGNGPAGADPAPLPMLYFCIPQNDKMLGYWDTVADRLYKIRHCMNIEGVVRQLALFEPPIDPGALVKAVAGGVDISSALADLNAPLPLYRFNVLLQKANEVCNDVKALGSALLAALEKKDAEALGLLRQSQEIRLLEAVKAVREKQIEEAKENLEGVKLSKAIVEVRRNYYRDIEKLIAQEELHLDKLGKAHNLQEAAQGVKLAASIISILPAIDLGASGFGGTPLAKFKIGGLELGQAADLAAEVLSFLSQMARNDSAMASSIASFDRRWEDWKLQERLAEKELDQMDKQIATAELRIALVEKELENHVLQIENAKATDDFMRSKYTNEELYQWQVGQISGVYFQSYKLAYDLAKRAERCFRFELGLQDSSYINFGYWDSLKKGLLSGEKLQYDLRRLETAHLDQNRREFELTKHISLALLNPLALVKLRETGRCFLNLPEEIFDLDFPGHYFRRIKSVSLTLPCVVGPYTTISCTLRLLKNSIRINTANGDNGYPRNTDDQGLPFSDDRFIENNIPVKAIAASNAQNDSGVFELSFRDERYLPFEGAGAISGWSLELFSDLPANNPDPGNPDFGKPLRQFDYSTISDAILHVKYTAREDAGVFKNGAVAHLRDYFSQDGATHSLRMFNLRQEFPNQWHSFLHPANPADGNIFELEMSPSLFPIRDAGKTQKVNTIWLLARCTDAGSYDVVMTPPLPAPPPADSDTMTLAPVNQYGGLHFSQKDVAAVGIEVVPTAPPVKWQLKMTRPGGGNLQEDPVKKVMEVEDVLLVLGYEWE